jgi:hypothetical protein
LHCVNSVKSTRIQTGIAWRNKTMNDTRPTTSHRPALAFDMRIGFAICWRIFIRSIRKNYQSIFSDFDTFCKYTYLWKIILSFRWQLMQHVIWGQYISTFCLFIFFANIPKLPWYYETYGIIFTWSDRHWIVGNIKFTCILYSCDIQLVIGKIILLWSVLI